MTPPLEILCARGCGPHAFEVVRWRRAGSDRATLVVKIELAIEQGRLVHVAAAPVARRERRQGELVVRPREDAPFLPNADVLCIAKPTETPSIGLHVLDGSRLVLAKSVAGARAHELGPLAEDAPARAVLVRAANLTQAPLSLPPEFDYRFFNTAPLDQQVPFLRGSETLVLRGLNGTEPSVVLRLPGIVPTARVASTHEREPLPLMLDTLLIDWSEQRLTLLWRGGLRMRGEPVRLELSVPGPAEEAADETAFLSPGMDLSVRLPFQRLADARGPERTGPVLAATPFEEDYTPAAVTPASGVDETMAVPFSLPKAATPTASPVAPTSSVAPVANASSSVPAHPTLPDASLRSWISTQHEPNPDETALLAAEGGRSILLPFKSSAAAPAPRREASLVPATPFDASYTPVAAPPSTGVDETVAVPFHLPKPPERIADAKHESPALAPTAPAALPDPRPLSLPSETAPPLVATPPQASSSDPLRASVLERLANGGSLAGLDLRDADLHELDLRGASLVRLTMTRANLSGAKLDGADLTGANLERAVLRRASLQSAKLDGAILARADLQGARLTRASLAKANLERAVLTEISGIEAAFVGANLRHVMAADAALPGADLDGADLRQAKLQGADLSRAKLRRVEASRADLSAAILSEADLTDASLRPAILKGADLRRATLANTDLRDADLSGANLRGAKQDTAKLKGANLTNATTD